MKRNGRGHGGESGTLWISFSDLMSALMLIFVLILFYAVYQYYDMLEVKTAELLRQSGILDRQSQALTLSQQELESKEQALAKAQTDLENKEREMNEQSQKLTETEQAQLVLQAKLLLQEDTLNSLQSRLNDQEKELEAALAAQQAQQELLTQQEAKLSEAQAAQRAQQALLTQQQTQMEAQQAQLDKLVGVKSAIIEELMRALADSNISGASVDDSGAIVFSSEMMFDVNRSTLKDVGKAFLNSFIPSYLRVLMSDQYSPYVSQIIIEGHTDTDGTFLKNMQLSQERAYAVLRYILSDEFTGISDSAKRRLEEIVTVNGRSYSDPIYRANGSVDMAASRRVVIKFRMNDEQMVNEMLSILENMNGRRRCRYGRRVQPDLRIQGQPHRAGPGFAALQLAAAVRRKHAAGRVQAAGVPRGRDRTSLGYRTREPARLRAGALRGPGAAFPDALPLARARVG